MASLAWRHPDKLTPRFKAWLDDAAAAAKVYLPITSDYRDLAANQAASGASGSSRHLFGEAVDFAIPHTGHGNLVGPLVAQLVLLAQMRGFLAHLEIELVASAKDNHLHVALDPKQTTPAIFGAAD